MILNDAKAAVETVLNFLNDPTKRTLLVKGYDNDAKVKVVLSCLNKVFGKGIIRTSSMSDIADHINRSFKNQQLPRNIKSTTNYALGKMTININSYATHTANNPGGNENTFTLFHPVQMALDDPKRYKALLHDLNKSGSSKIILITTNEWGIKNWDIENHVDEVYFYSVENDNPQIMTNLRNNGAI
ncbi:hypothetical protein [Virgibacillus alimentarius]|uniref:hypothetical protein n=1 Tax=Virgibacillus alimentarius TaxID=698769 RepID=UPI000493A33A|nr:hypothetical protein [Virgibacillus alimentarius]